MARRPDVRKTNQLDENALRTVDEELASLTERVVVGPVAVADMDTAAPQDASDLISVHPEPALLQLLNKCSRMDWTPDNETMLFLGGNAASATMEEFRALRIRLQQVRKERNLKSLVLTSAVSGEGRSFIAANLAHVLALQPDSRVLLIDADLRKPSLHALLGAPRTPGLSNHLLQDMEVFSIVQRGQEEGLYFIPAGEVIAGPTELLANGRLQSLIRKFGSLFDWIILDSPAASHVSDACAIANFCDGVLFVVRSDSTPFDLARKAQERFSQDAMVGVVLNQIETRKPRPVKKVDQPEFGLLENRRNWLGLRWGRTTGNED